MSCCYIFFSFFTSVSIFSCLRTILGKMGLLGKVTSLQAKKKWDNLKRKYKVCKN